jgi:MFS family permease
MTSDRTRVNVVLLAICQAIGMTGMTIIMTTTALVGNMIAENKALSTLPLGLQFTATMLTVIPASLLMRRIGRRGGFLLGSCLGMAGGLVCAYGIYKASLPIFAAGSMLFGCFMAFLTYYRFAAADTASAGFKGKAISLVLAGGVVAALFGPETAKWSRDLFAPVMFAGCFVIIAGLHVVAFIVLQFLDIPRTVADTSKDTGRPLAEIARQPVFLVACAAATIGYGTMSFVMTATPLAVVGCGLRFEDAAFVIQWHALGMFAPSFVTGHLIGRFGVLNVMFAGVVLLAACVAVAHSGVELEQFWFALLALGVGWNFLYLGGTTLLTECYRPEEKAKVQALNDFLTFSTTAVASFSAGALQNLYGWTTINLAVVPLVLLAAAMILWLRRLRQPVAA